jgi:hypothetical protein
VDDPPEWPPSVSVPPEPEVPPVAPDDVPPDDAPPDDEPPDDVPPVDSPPDDIPPDDVPPDDVPPDDVPPDDVEPPLSTEPSELPGAFDDEQAASTKIEHRNPNLERIESAATIVSFRRSTSRGRTAPKQPQKACLFEERTLAVPHSAMSGFAGRDLRRRWRGFFQRSESVRPRTLRNSLRANRSSRFCYRAAVMRR